MRLFLDIRGPEQYIIEEQKNANTTRDPLDIAAPLLPHVTHPPISFRPMIKEFDGVRIPLVPQTSLDWCFAGTARREALPICKDADENAATHRHTLHPPPDEALHVKPTHPAVRATWIHTADSRAVNAQGVKDTALCAPCITTVSTGSSTSERDVEWELEVGSMPPQYENGGNGSTERPVEAPYAEGWMDVPLPSLDAGGDHAVIALRTKITSPVAAGPDNNQDYYQQDVGVIVRIANLAQGVLRKGGHGGMMCSRWVRERTSTESGEGKWRCVFASKRRAWLEEAMRVVMDDDGGRGKHVVEGDLFDCAGVEWRVDEVAKME